MTFSRSPKVKTTSAPRRFVSFAIVALMLLQNLLILSPVSVQAAVSSTIVISEFRTQGPSGGNDEFIELYNLSAGDINIGGWKINASNTSGTTGTRATISAGTIIPANGHYLLTNNAASGYSGTVAGNQTYATGVTNDGGIALLNSSNAIIDQVGMSAGSAYKEGTTLAQLSTNVNRCYERKPGSTAGNATDTDNNSADFQTINPCNPQNLLSPATPTGTATPTPTPTGTPIPGPTATPTPTPVSTNPTGTGSANPNSVLPGNTTTLTVNVTSGANPTSSGVAVSADLSAIGGAAAQPFTGSGGTFTFQAAVSVGTAPGVKTLPFTVSDEQGRASGNNSISLTVEQPATPPDHIVISQIYGGGGNSGATYKNDYIELYNPTGATVNLLDWSLQYASSTGSGWDGSKQTLYGSIAPGEYFLVALASGGAVGSDLPASNLSGGINMSGTGGKIALVGNSAALTSNCPLSDPDLVDFVGYGTSADCWEGPTAVTPVPRAAAPSNTTALYRYGNGATDTNNNRNDFFTSVPSPRRTAAITAPPEVGPKIEGTEPAVNSLSAPRDGSITIDLNEPVYLDPAWFDINCATTGQHTDATISSGNNSKSYVITPNRNFQPGEQCAVKIYKDSVHDQDTDDSAPNTDTLTADYSWTFSVATGTPAPYAPDVHLTFGNPSGAIAATNEPNNYLMEKPEFALSYNRDRGTPNWVSWHLEDTWTGSLTRVDTFRPDPAVPSDWYRVQSTDYIGSGFDRGHLTPNADRDKETSIPINQATFLMSNMMPQAPDNNQGPWANLENYLRTLLPNNEIYIVAGGAGTGGTGSNGGVTTTIANGRVTVPAQTWKVALIIPKGDNDLSRVTASAKTIAVIMPNKQGIRTSNSDDWQAYLTSVDQVESLTGYDFYSNLPDAVENSVEAGVNGANPPGVANQSVTVDEDTPQLITLSAASANSPLTYTIVSPPAHGAFSGSAPNLTYTPAANYNGADSFTFRANYGSQTSNLATVTITVNAVNDLPTANGGTIVTGEDTASAPFAFTGSDTDGDALTYEVVSNPAHGTFASGVYTPDANFNGNDSFTFVAKDTVSTSVPATISVTVNPINDAPTAAAQSVTTDEDTAKTITLSGSDIDSANAPLTFTITGQPAHGILSGTGANLTYTPAANYYGADSFTFLANDGESNSETTTISITVGAVNDAPNLAEIGNQTLVWGGNVSFTPTASDVDVTANSLSFSLNCTGGVPSGVGFNTSTGTFGWTPTAAQAGATYNCSITVNDNSGAANATATRSFSVTVNRHRTALVYTGTVAGQYSDPATLTATLTDLDANGSQIAGQTVNFLLGSQTATGLSDGSTAAGVNLIINQSAAVVSVTPGFGGSTGYAPVTGAAQSFTINRENAIVSPSTSNPSAVKVATNGGTAASITFQAAISEVADGSLGDITKAVPVTFTLTPIGPGSSIVKTVGVLANVGGVWTASATFTNVPVNVYDITISVGGNFYTGAASSVLAIYDPSLGFTTGGGKVIRNGVLSEFGFNVKYLKNGNIQGQMMYVEHRASGDVVVKSNAMESLSIVKGAAGSGSTAIIIGRATVGGVGNYRFRTTVVDNGEPGANDKFGLQVTNPAGETVADLTFSPITLSGGNIQVP